MDEKLQPIKTLKALQVLKAKFIRKAINFDYLESAKIFNHEFIFYKLSTSSEVSIILGPLHKLA